MILSNNKGMLHAKGKNLVVYEAPASRKMRHRPGQFLHQGMRSLKYPILLTKKNYRGG